MLPERLRNDVMVRIATLEGVQPMAMRELNEVLTQLLSGGEITKKSSLGGVKAAADILNYMGGAIEASVLANIREHDAELAQKIQDQMFTFDNILDLDDRSVQLLLREVQSETLIIALKGTSQELKDLIFKNMSSRAAEALKEDLEAKGPVRCPRSRPNRRKSSRSCANWSTRARSSSAARVARKAGGISPGRIHMSRRGAEPCPRSSPRNN
jgi:flagellar motor switch protein FliG